MMKLDSRLFDLKISWPCRAVKVFLLQSRSTTAGLRFLFWFDEKIKPPRPTGWLIEFDEKKKPQSLRDSSPMRLKAQLRTLLMPPHLHAPAPKHEREEHERDHQKNFRHAEQECFVRGADEIEIRHAIHRTAVPNDEIDDLEQFAAAAPHAERERERRNEERAREQRKTDLPFARENRAQQNAAAHEQRNENSGKPRGRKLSLQNVRRGEDELVRAMQTLARAHGRPQEQRPNPREGKQELPRDAQWHERARDDQTERDELPPTIHAFEHELKLGEQHAAKVVARGD